MTDIGVSAVTAYTGAGRVIVAATAQATRQAMIEHWWAHLQAGTDPAQVLLVAPTRADADDLGARAQARMLVAGRLGPVAATTSAGTLLSATGSSPPATTAGSA